MQLLRVLIFCALLATAIHALHDDFNPGRDDSSLCLSHPQWCFKSGVTWNGIGRDIHGGVNRFADWLKDGAGSIFKKGGYQPYRYQPYGDYNNYASYTPRIHPAYYASAYGYGPAAYGPQGYGYAPQGYPMYYEDGRAFKGGLEIRLPIGQVKDAVYKGLGWLNQVADKIFKDEENTASPAQEEADPVEQVPAPEDNDNEELKQDTPTVKDQSFKSIHSFDDFGNVRGITRKGQFDQKASVPAYGGESQFKRGHFIFGGLDKIVEMFG
uniref:Secreted protein n=1 Tax=Steinernema glaseri TaxID=37863 RepID=A0A1I7XVL8_9BILA